MPSSDEVRLRRDGVLMTRTGLVRRNKPAALRGPPDSPHYALSGVLVAYANMAHPIISFHICSNFFDGQTDVVPRANGDWPSAIYQVSVASCSAWRFMRILTAGDGHAFECHARVHQRTNASDPDIVWSERIGAERGSIMEQSFLTRANWPNGVT